MRIDPDFLCPQPKAFCAVASARVWLSVVSIILLLASSAFGQRRHGSDPLDTLGENPNQEDGWEVLRKFRSLGISGDYSFRFQLQIMPRREKTRKVAGVLYGTMNDLGPLTRVDVVVEEASVDSQAKFVPEKTVRLLLQNGVLSNAFMQVDGENGGVPRVVETNDYFHPIAESNFTVFDLLMPYTYWQRFRYEGRTTFRGRPTHVFWMYPPAEDAYLQKVVSGVRIYLDEEFYALMQAEIFDADKKPSKTVTVVDFKKVDEEWILNQVDVRDEQTRDKTRFKVLDARMHIDVPASVFSMQGLTDTVYGKALGSFEAKASPGL